MKYDYNTTIKHKPYIKEIREYKPSIYIYNFFYIQEGFGFSFYRKPNLIEYFKIHFLKKDISLFCQYKFSYKTKKWNKLKTQKHNKKTFNKALNSALLDSEFSDHYYKYCI